MCQRASTLENQATMTDSFHLAVWISTNALPGLLSVIWGLITHSRPESRPAGGQPATVTLAIRCPAWYWTRSRALAQLVLWRHGWDADTSASSYQWTIAGWQSGGYTTTLRCWQGYSRDFPRNP